MRGTFVSGIAALLLAACSGAVGSQPSATPELPPESGPDSPVLV